jgi:hypothetical protein
MITINYIPSIPINYQLISVPIGCQYTIPNGYVCSGGFIVYYMPSFPLFQ